MEKKTILIIGVSSFVGSNLAEYFKEHYKVIGTYNNCRVEIPGVLTLSCDVLNRHAVQTVLYTFKPDITIYAVGLSSLIDCHENDKLADALNTGGVFNVTTFTERYKSKFCFISNSFVFPGIKNEYIENETPMTNTIYGNTLASSEFYVQKSCLNYLILRTCPLYGRGYNPEAPKFCESLEKNLFLNKPVYCDGRLHTGHLDVQIFAKYLHQCFEAGITNRLLHVCTSNIMTRYEFALEFAKVFKLNEGMLSKVISQFPFDAKNTAAYRTEGELFYQMNTINLESTINVKMPTIQESISYTYSNLASKVKSSKNIKKTTGISFI